VAFVCREKKKRKKNSTKRSISMDFMRAWNAVPLWKNNCARERAFVFVYVMKRIKLN
jgi:hypothetical protein